MTTITITLQDMPEGVAVSTTAQPPVAGQRITAAEAVLLDLLAVLKKHSGTIAYGAPDPGTAGLVAQLAAARMAGQNVQAELMQIAHILVCEACNAPPQGRAPDPADYIDPRKDPELLAAKLGLHATSAPAGPAHPLRPTPDQFDTLTNQWQAVAKLSQVVHDVTHNGIDLRTPAAREALRASPGVDIDAVHNRKAAS